MLAVAADWSAVVPRSTAEIMSDPALSHYIHGWKREDDRGVIAVAESSRIGAAWWRFLSVEDAGYGFVAAEIPEITIGVVKAMRGHGVGRHLLDALVQEARGQALPGLSLSVSPQNPAAKLYRQVGFEEVGTRGSSLTMLIRLDA
jgi:ribosomal protein S18 acetylase RimI-like enzyme